MTSTPKIKHCKTCGAEFAASPNDYTVNCPDHRGRKTSATAQFEAYAYAYAKAGEARKAGRAAQAAGEDHSKHAADFAYWMQRAREAQS